MDFIAAVADDVVISIYTRTISDMEEERITSMNFEHYISGRIRMMAEYDSVTEELFTDDNANSDSFTENENV